MNSLAKKILRLLWFFENNENEMLRPLEGAMGNASSMTGVWRMSINMCTTLNLILVDGNLWCHHWYDQGHQWNHHPLLVWRWHVQEYCKHGIWTQLSFPILREPWFPFKKERVLRPLKGTMGNGIPCRHDEMMSALLAGKGVHIPKVQTRNVITDQSFSRTEASIGWL